MGLPEVIAHYSYVIAIIIIVLFLVYIFLKPKQNRDNSQSISQDKAEPPKEDLPSTNQLEEVKGNESKQKDNTIQRTKRGFKILKDKLQNSTIVKNIQAQNESDDTFGLNDSPIKNYERDLELDSKENPFATKF